MITVTRSRPASDDWTLYDLSDPRWCVWEKPRGRDRFQVMERGAGPRGTGRSRAWARTLDKALELASTLAPSTTAEILAGIEPHGDRERLEKLIRLGTPGTRLWVLPYCGENGNEGTGYAATSEGLAINGAEALFGGLGGEIDCWLVRWRGDGGHRDKGLFVTAIEDAERAWWIVDEHGNLRAGGPPIYDEGRALEIAAEVGGNAQLGPICTAEAASA
jgi:hypothetical protein